MQDLLSELHIFIYDLQSRQRNLAAIAQEAITGSEIFGKEQVLLNFTGLEPSPHVSMLSL